MNSTTDKRLLSILVNDDFINYVLNPNLILSEKWDNYFSKHPNYIPFFNEARQILLGESDTRKLTYEDAFNLENIILKKCGLALR